MSQLQQQEINLGDLNIEQLNQLKSQFENELKQFTTSYSGLKEAQTRFTNSNLALNELKPENKNKDILVPLTSSIYIPGKLNNINNVLVEIGTGYYMQKTIPEAKKFMDRKIEFLQKNTSSLTELIDTKRNQLEMIIGFMQQKLKN